MSHINKLYIGKDENGDYVYQELDEQGVIRGFSIYSLIELYNETKALDNHAWLHAVTIKGKTFISGEKPAKVLKEPKALDNVCEVNVIHCGECGAAHDSEQCRPDIVIIDCEAYCKECIKAEMLLVEVTSPSDIFSAKDLTGVNTEGFEEIESIFCDNSGMGNSSEPACTKSQAELEMQRILKENSGEQLFVGLTGIGQFQVYVGVFKRAA